MRHELEISILKEEDNRGNRVVSTTITTNRKRIVVATHAPLGIADDGKKHYLTSVVSQRYPLQGTSEPRLGIFNEGDATNKKAARKEHSQTVRAVLKTLRIPKIIPHA